MGIILYKECELMREIGYTEQEIIKHYYKRKIPMYTVSIPYKNLNFKRLIDEKKQIVEEIKKILVMKRKSIREKANQIEDILVNKFSKSIFKKEALEKAIENENVIEDLKSWIPLLMDLKWYEEFIENLI